MKEKILKILIRQLGIQDEEIQDDAYIMEDLGANSLDAVEIVMALEEEFGITIEDEDIVRLKTVRDVIDYVEARAE